MFKRTRSAKISGVTVTELMVAMSIFALMSVVLFALFGQGADAVALANARQQAELSLNKTHMFLERDLAQARPGQVGAKRISAPGNGDALWFLSAHDPNNPDVETNFQHDEVTGLPIPQANVIYYLIRPGNYSDVSGGLTAAVDPDPTNDFYAPHKFLIRKVVDRTPGDLTTPEELLTSAEVDSYITAPTGYEMSALNSEPDVEEARIVADKMLSFQVALDQSVVEVGTSALRLDEARKEIAIGSTSLKNHPLTTHRLAKFHLRK